MLVDSGTQARRGGRRGQREIEVRGREDGREIDRAGLQPLSCPQMGCLFTGNDMCCGGGNDLLGPM